MTPLKEQQFLGVFADLPVKEGRPWGNLLVLVILVVLTLQIIIIWNPTLCCLAFLAVTRPIAWLLVTTTSTRARAQSRSSASARSSSIPTGTATTSLQGNAPREGFAGGEAAQMEMFFFPMHPSFPYPGGLCSAICILSAATTSPCSACPALPP